MANLLFSPSGRIGPSAFTKGILILSGILAVVSLLPFVSMGVATAGSFLAFLLIIPFLFLNIKRAHDAGKSGWMSIVHLIIYLVLMFVASIIISKLFTGGFDIEAVKLASEEAARAGDIAGALEAAAGPAKAQAIPSAIASLVVGYVFALIINVMNKADDHDNQYGPETGNP